MKTYDLCKYIQLILLRTAAEVISYDWSDKFAVRKIKKTPEVILKAPGVSRIDPWDLSMEQMEELGFQRWDRDSKLYLIPLWLLPFLVDEFNVGNISNDDINFVKREELDNTSHFGCIAYGVIPTPAKTVI